MPTATGRATNRMHELDQLAQQQIPMFADERIHFIHPFHLPQCRPLRRVFVHFRHFRCVAFHESTVLLIERLQSLPEMCEA